ncbi:unnamed protein product [Musa acuminata subsp. malaccensis]|uniref:(wild Malaysian banana) hypothetical protein n=1 Tax=Musa acuminata subsp. malaccensis TaxID=214687 RepID=A0A804IJN0_MUSAM|nr:unnamed protein product [Musa acuminata subsp. malaccensis]
MVHIIIKKGNRRFSEFHDHIRSCRSYLILFRTGLLFFYMALIVLNNLFQV